jgi:hypothetical protein|tara:strand:- start:453 stop:689 length:237 start_codon:yes stop_codon:yes gene_type:complete
MTFWYMLVVTYSLEVNGAHENEFRVAFENQPSCAAAMDKIYPVIYAEYRDSMAQCIKTDVPSKSMRPKMRPKNLKKEK